MFPTQETREALEADTASDQRKVDFHRAVQALQSLKKLQPDQVLIDYVQAVRDIRLRPETADNTSFTRYARTYYAQPRARVMSSSPGMPTPAALTSRTLAPRRHPALLCWK